MNLTVTSGNDSMPVLRVDPIALIRPMLYGRHTTITGISDTLTHLLSLRLWEAVDVFA